MPKILKLIKDLTWYNKVEKSKEILRLLTTIFLQDAPEDGNIYGRKDGEWEEFTTGGGGLEQREIVYLTEDTILPSNANSEYYINEVNSKVTIQSGLYALGTSIIIQGSENDEIYSTFSDTQSGILINGNYVDETTPFLLQTSGNIILTKTLSDDFAESWVATYEPNNFPTVSNLATLQSITNQGRFTNQKIVSSSEISVKATENSTFGVIISPNGIILEPGAGLADFIAMSKATEPYNQSLSFSDGEFAARIGIQPGGSGNTFFKLPSRTGGTRILLDDLSLPQVANSYANDTEAASGGVQIGQLYHTAGVVKIRLS
jgi:hypothetical protein